MYFRGPGIGMTMGDGKRPNFYSAFGLSTGWIMSLLAQSAGPLDVLHEAIRAAT